MAKTTRTINIRDFRDNLTKLLREAQDNNVHFVIMRHSVPVAKVTPMKADASLEQLMEDVSEARKAYKKGETYTADEVLDMIAVHHRKDSYRS